MLSDAFLEWWFAPPGMPPGADPLARRDRYPWWCAEAGVRPELPPAFDPDWQVAAVDAGAELRQAAALFGGIVAARAQDHVQLARLALAERRWCMSIAMTQPLKDCFGLRFAPDDPAELRGLAELARRLEHGFPGLWTRWRLLLPAPLAGRVDGLLQGAAAPAAGSDARVQRCWQMCRARAAA